MSHDTIVALASGLTGAAIALMRLSGPNAPALLATLCDSDRDPYDLFPERRATLRTLYVESKPIDQALITRFQAPASYTGEHMVEITCHASPYIVQTLTQALLQAGARYAKPGEFTARALLNGKIDPAQAQAIDSLIRAQTSAQHNLAFNALRGSASNHAANLREQLLKLSALLELELDFSEEDVQFADRDQLASLASQCLEHTRLLDKALSAANAIRTGIPIVIVGPPNAGKSTLFNALLQQEKAIVSKIPGTTRDPIEARFVHAGVPFLLVDTAGIHQTDNPIERIGIQRAKQNMRQAHGAIVLLEAAHLLQNPNAAIDEEFARLTLPWRALILSKSDLLTPEQRDAVATIAQTIEGFTHVIIQSNHTHEGYPQILQALASIAEQLEGQAQLALGGIPYRENLQDTIREIEQLAEAISQNLTQELLAHHCRKVADLLAPLAGEIPTERILEHIFTHFCIGK